MNPCKPTGPDILHNPQLNKGTAFTRAERNEMGTILALESRPADVETMIKAQMYYPDY